MKILWNEDRSLVLYKGDKELVLWWDERLETMKHHWEPKNPHMPTIRRIREANLNDYHQIIFVIFTVKKHENE